ncbi:MAG: hypothetical protein N2V76_01400 [Methanophagales archaeon]|nr:hypothetical protein [Methanophagales archaeon]
MKRQDENKIDCWNIDRCLYYLQGQAKMIKKESALYRVKCKGCGREFLSNTGKEYCFDCEKKRG